MQEREYIPPTANFSFLSLEYHLVWKLQREAESGEIQPPNERQVAYSSGRAINNRVIRGAREREREKGPSKSRQSIMRCPCIPEWR